MPDNPLACIIEDAGQFSSIIPEGLVESSRSLEVSRKMWLLLLKIKLRIAEEQLLKEAIDSVDLWDLSIHVAREVTQLARYDINAASLFAFEAEMLRQEFSSSK